MTRKVIDIETNNLLADMLDYSSLPYKLHKNAILWCVVIRDVDKLNGNMGDINEIYF